MIQFIKTRDVKSPLRNVQENAGIDCYIPENTEEFRKDLLIKNPQLQIVLAPRFEDICADFHDTYMLAKTGEIYIAPHKDIIIPSGIRSKFGPHLALIANNKSGIATKKKLIFGASVIDASYQGEWHYHLINTSDEYQVVECSTKVIQFIPHLISTDELEVLDLSPEEFYTEKTSRGDGGFGSTGIK